MAEAYERFRPEYPVALYDIVMTYAGHPIRTALEIGAGTGKATRLRSAWFEDVTQTVVERRFTWSASDYVGHLSTISAYLQLPPPVQAEVYRRITASLPETVEITADIVVHLARRSGG